MSAKQKVIEDLFRTCKRRGSFAFNNEEVKRFCRKHQFGNPFDVTKIDSSSKIPSLLKREDYYIVHAGGGRHQFVKGISSGFHLFEEIHENEVFDWKYRKSILNELDTSESNVFPQAASHGKGF